VVAQRPGGSHDASAFPVPNLSETEFSPYLSELRTSGVIRPKQRNGVIEPTYLYVSP